MPAPNTHIDDLIKQVKELSGALRDLSDPRKFKQVIVIMKRPGWTTPAELAFARAIVDGMLAHTVALQGLKDGLLDGSKAVVGR